MNACNLILKLKTFKQTSQTTKGTIKIKTIGILNNLFVYFRI